MPTKRKFSRLAGAIALTLAFRAYGQAPPMRAQPPKPATPPPATPPPPAPPGAAPATPEPEPPGASAPPPTSMDAIAKALDVPYRPRPGGSLVKFNLQDADLAELVNHVSGITGKRFIYGQKVRQIKVTVVSPTPVTIDEAYEAFLSILQANGMTVVPHGRFLKIVDTGAVVAETTPVYDRGEPVPDTDRFVTRLYRLRSTSATEAGNLLAKFKSKEGDISVYEPGSLLILTDRGSNIQRMVRILEEIDVGGAGSQMWIEPIHYGSASDMAKQFNDIFELNQQGKPGGTGGNAAGLTKVIADDKTNSLVVVGTEDAYLRLLELLKRVDVAPAASGKIRVLALQHAMAEELAATMTQMLTSAKAASNANTPGAPAPVFEGEVRVVADKPTNSLVVTSSARDYAQIRVVVDQLDHARRQVFIDAVIMDVSVSRSMNLGIAYHGGAATPIASQSDTIFLGGLDPLKSVLPTDPNQLQGLALGVRGPELSNSQNTFPGLNGVSIPAFGVILNALATSGDTNVLSTPHIIATDNTPAEINIGQNIALQQNVGGIPALGGAIPGAAGAAGGLGALGALGGLGAFGGFGAAQRHDVGTHIKVTPHINAVDQVRLEIQEEDSAPGPAQGALGAVPITQRRANTTVVVDDQQTVVIGGLMRDTVTKSSHKIPVLGDLPVLGFLFRSTTNTKEKSNLLLILTPYIIRDQQDLRKVFERKMQERQEFLDRYFVFEGQWEPPRDYSRTNGLVEDIRKAYADLDEQLRMEEESRSPDKGGHEPSPPIELPSGVKGSPPGTGPVPAGAAPAAPNPPPRRPARRPRTDDAPIRINPIARSVTTEGGP